MTNEPEHGAEPTAEYLPPRVSDLGGLHELTLGSVGLNADGLSSTGS